MLHTPLLFVIAVLSKSILVYLMEIDEMLIAAFGRIFVTLKGFDEMFVAWFDRMFVAGSDRMFVAGFVTMFVAEFTRIIVAGYSQTIRTR